jgi:hypothetical protein
MWSTQMWFDVAVVMGIFAIGNIMFGHFEEHKPKARRVLNVVLVAGVSAALSCAGLRRVAYGLIGALGLAAAYIHICWLPSQATGSTAGPESRGQSITNCWASIRGSRWKHRGRTRTRSDGTTGKP